ncbi:MAG: hypothetical protein NE327_01910 [Lentisphaeraceae bacterium]|nr:hypothetical protein [Lentisphaeraceae bacterium]
MNKKVYIAAGFNTAFMGPGRKEFNPRLEMPDYEYYLQKAAKGCMDQIPNPEFDEGIISNFMAARFIRQGNLAGLLPSLVPSLKYKPCFRAEGACGSGGLALTMAIRSILSGMADSIFVTGFEIQNTVKALYGADILAGAAYHKGLRKEGHAFFFPGIFSDRAGACYEKFGYERMRQGMARWYENAVENARKCSSAQEFHNSNESLFELGMTKPNGARFVEHLNLYDCSKVSDGASSLAVYSETGLKKAGIDKSNAVEIIGFNSCEEDLTKPPTDLTELKTTAVCAQHSFKMAGITANDLDLLELHDCFSITGILALEALGICEKGKAANFVFEGNTKTESSLPVNASGGLCGFGHPTGATGVRQMVDLQQQLTETAENQVYIRKGLGMMVSMGGNDKTLSSLIVKKI